MAGIVRLPQEPPEMQSRDEKRATWETLIREHPVHVQRALPKPPPSPDDWLQSSYDEANGDRASYQAIHRWVENLLGKPRKCEHCGTTEGMFDWCSIDHKYKRNSEDWIRLCRSHHRQLDRKGLCVSRNYSLE